jgi:hypothetical protein
VSILLDVLCDEVCGFAKVVKELEDFIMVAKVAHSQLA